jgi:hypothetical protein
MNPSKPSSRRPAHLEKLGVVNELTKRRRGRVFSYHRYVKELASESVNA